MITSGVAGFLAAPTGPRRLRQRLGRDVGALYALARAIQTTSALCSRFPAELTGDNLMALFGSCLRDLLAASGQVTTKPRSVGRSGPSDVVAATPKSRTLPAAPPASVRTRPDLLDIVRSARPSADHGGTSDVTRDVFPSRDTGAIANPSWPRAISAADAGRQRCAAELPTTDQTGRTPVQVVTLAASLRRYFATATPAPSARTANERAWTARRSDVLDAAPASDDHAAPTVARGRSRWRDWDGGGPQPSWQAHDALHRQMPSPRGWSPATERADHAGEGVRFAVALPLVATESDPPELAELMADVLRDQALRHGIDLS